MTPDAMTDQMRGILDETASRIEGLRQPAASRPVALAVATTLRGYSPTEDLITRVDRLQRDVAEISELLHQSSERLRDAEDAEAARDPEGEAWWARRRRAVADAFSAAAPDALDLWVTTWLEALERDAWARCAEVIALGDESAEAGSVTGDLTATTRALSRRSTVAAARPVERLVERDVGGPRVQGKLTLLLVRILLHEFSDRGRINDVAEDGLDRLRDTEGEPWARTAVAEVLLVNDGPESARAMVHPAAVGHARATDALILLGQVHEREGQWAEADRCYDVALSDPLATRDSLLRRTPARLLVRAARRSGVAPTVAIEALERALTLGVPGDGDYPDKGEWVSLGYRLRTRAGADDAPPDTLSRAADAFYQGGLRYGWSGYAPRAVELFGIAHSLAPDVAEYPWQQAEALRLAAVGVDGVADRTRLMHARELVDEGFALRAPVADEAWVLVTRAKIDEELADPAADPALSLERALLLDPGYTLGYAFLAEVLRRQGWLSEAEETIDQVVARSGTADPFVFATLVDLRLDRGAYEDAEDLLDQRHALGFDDPALPVRRAEVRLLQGRPDRALEVLADVSDPEVRRSDVVRATRALALATAARGEPSRAEAARDEYRSLWLDTRSDPSPWISGRAAFGAGLVDDAIARYRALAEAAPPHLPYRRELGQMLLVRGDVDDGRVELERGIADCPFAEHLRWLLAVDVPNLRDRVAEEPHAQAVEAVLETLEPMIRDRIENLQRRRREGTEPAASAALARAAAESRDPLGALRRYGGLAGSPDVPEACLGAARAAGRLLDDADARFTRGDEDAARATWSELEREVPGTTGCDEVVAALRARRLLTDLVDDPGTADDVLGAAATDTDLREALVRALPVVAGSTDRLWSMRDLLVAVREGTRTRAAVRDLAAELAAGLPYSGVYALGAHDTVRYAGFLSVRQLEVVLGPDVSEGLSTADLETSLGDLRTRLRAELGVRIPWVHHRGGPELASTQVEFHVYGRFVGTVYLGGEPVTWAAQLVEGLDRTIRGHLYRLVGVDDVGLWLEGWDLHNADSPTWSPRDPVVDRLRLARVLRMLLREGASVADRHRIVEGLESGRGTARGHESETLEILRVVRCTLGREALGLPPDADLKALPPALEGRLGAALVKGHAVWRLPREEAVAVGSELRQWFGNGSGGARAVVVEDPRVRPFVWRLLADQRPLVVSREELGDG